MTEYQRLFLVQARTDFEVFELLKAQSDLPPCHSLHYLQMATELLGKAHAWKDGPPPKLSHKAFVPFLRSLSTNRKAQNLLGYKQNESWENLIRNSLPLAESIQKLAPDLAEDGPNPEYPWPRNAPKIAPKQYTFTIWQELQEPTMGRQFLKLLKNLFAAAEAIL